MSKYAVGAALVTTIVISLCLISGFTSSNSPIAFFSSESKNSAGSPVANQISFQEVDGKDVWMMNQSHNGAGASAEKWSRIAIVVDRAEKNAKFLELLPGALEWTGNEKETEFKTSCAFCHANGPRNIRPLTNLDGKPMSFAETFKIWRWNLRMKSYGRLHSFAAAKTAEGTRAVPFKVEGDFANIPLKAAVCVMCHRESGPFARGTLTRQNANTIRHMVATGTMPPFGILIPQAQRVEIQNFLIGL